MSLQEEGRGISTTHRLTGLLGMPPLVDFSTSGPVLHLTAPDSTFTQWKPNTAIFINLLTTELPTQIFLSPIICLTMRLLQTARGDTS